MKERLVLIYFLKKNFNQKIFQIAEPFDLAFDFF
jgi:hypothetical protein